MQYCMTDNGLIKDIEHNDQELATFIAFVSKRYARKNKIIEEYVNSTIKSIYSINNDGKKDGFLINLINNKLSSFVLMKNDKYSGYSYHWHNNGKKFIEAKYICNCPDGYRTKWDEDGNIIEIVRYESYMLKLSIELNKDNSIDDLYIYNN